MALTDLDAQIHETHARDANLFSVFFDMENAFPGIWTYCICQILKEIGLRGPFPFLIQNFLIDRSLRVQVADELSEIQYQENGVPKAHHPLVRYS